MITKVMSKNVYMYQVTIFFHHLVCFPVDDLVVEHGKGGHAFPLQVVAVPAGQKSYFKIF